MCKKRAYTYIHCIFPVENHCHRDRETTVDKRARKKLIIASILCLLFMMAEIIGKLLIYQTHIN